MNKDKILDLLFFLKEKEYRIDNNENITVWLDFSDIQEFTDIFRYDKFCEGSKEVILLNDQITLNLYDFINGMGEDTDYIIKKLKEFNEE